MKKCCKNCAVWVQKTPFLNGIAFGECCSQDVYEKHPNLKSGKTSSIQSCDCFITKIKEKK